MWYGAAQSNTAGLYFMDQDPDTSFHPQAEDHNQA